MAVKPGDTVHMICWDSIVGDYVEEFVVEEIAADHIKIRQVAEYRMRQRVEVDKGVQSRPLKYLEYFDLPPEEKIKLHYDSQTWLLAALSGKTQ